MITVKRYFSLYRKDTRVYERFPGREYQLLPGKREGRKIEICILPRFPPRWLIHSLFPFFPFSLFPFFLLVSPGRQKKRIPFGVVSFPSLPSDFGNNFFPCSALHGLNFPAPQGALNRIESGIGSMMMYKLVKVDANYPEQKIKIYARKKV